MRTAVTFRARPLLAMSRRPDVASIYVALTH